MKGRVLISEDSQAVARLAARTLSQAGYQCEICLSPQDVLSALSKRGADVVLADMATRGMELLRNLREQEVEVALVMLTASPGVAAAVAAIRQGAFDYIVKPFEEDELIAIVERAIELARLRCENLGLRRKLEIAGAVSSFLAESAAGKQLLALIRRLAATDSSVLIEGESGTGKEMAARMIHHLGPRTDRPLVVLNCRTGDREAADSGLLERASGGTLFFDEVAEASPGLQSRLMELIERQERSGGAEPGRVAVRMSASASCPLRDEVGAGRFRADLFFRLNVLPLRIPPLRERRDDIIPLARQFLAHHAARLGRPLALTSEAERELVSYPWPGNIRELRSVIERAVVLTPTDFLTSKSFALAPRGEPGRHEPEGLHLAPRPEQTPAHHEPQSPRATQGAGADADAA
ncbi:MAG: sigma-54 dependent transcriptional regulator, partial [Candidatus Binataceae bacterium]